MTYDFFMTHGLTMAGFIILLIIITSYLLKIRSVKLSHANKAYIVLLISVFIMVVLDLVTGYMCLVGNINTFLELKQIDNIELNLDGEVNGTIKNEGDSISRE